eukprot:COSAG02_NODE_2485_length_8709_cov_23.301394_7_plen_163_part_00
MHAEHGIFVYTIWPLSGAAPPSSRAPIPRGRRWALGFRMQPRWCCWSPPRTCLPAAATALSCRAGTGWEPRHSRTTQPAPHPHAAAQRAASTDGARAATRGQPSTTATAPASPVATSTTAAVQGLRQPGTATGQRQRLRQGQSPACTTISGVRVSTITPPHT